MQQYKIIRSDPILLLFLRLLISKIEKFLIKAIESRKMFIESVSCENIEEYNRHCIGLTLRHVVGLYFYHCYYSFRSCFPFWLILSARAHSKMDERQPVYLWLCFVTKQILFWRRQLTRHYAADKALPDNDEREETADKTLPDKNEGKMRQWGNYGG